MIGYVEKIEWLLYKYAENMRRYTGKNSKSPTNKMESKLIEKKW